MSQEHSCIYEMMWIHFVQRPVLHYIQGHLITVIREEPQN